MLLIFARTAKINSMTTKKDQELFQEHIRGVTPLKRKSRVVHKKRVPAIKKSIAENRHADIIELANDIATSCLPEEQLFFARPDLPVKTIRKLRQGKLDFKATIDLHAMHTERARLALQQFLARCQQQQIRAVLIVHGKGGAIIKSAVASWLRNYPKTLAFCSAQPKHGGAGALYLLLKK